MDKSHILKKKVCNENERLQYLLWERNSKLFSFSKRQNVSVYFLRNEAEQLAAQTPGAGPRELTSADGVHWSQLSHLPA